MEFPASSVFYPYFLLLPYFHCLFLSFYRSLFPPPAFLPLPLSILLPVRLLSYQRHLNLPTAAFFPSCLYPNDSFIPSSLLSSTSQSFSSCLLPPSCLSASASFHLLTVASFHLLPFCHCLFQSYCQSVFSLISVISVFLQLPLLTNCLSAIASFNLSASPSSLLSASYQSSKFLQLPLSASWLSATATFNLLPPSTFLPVRLPSYTRKSSIQLPYSLSAFLAFCLCFFPSFYRNLFLPP
jgi:hypothetical protein